MWQSVTVGVTFIWSQNIYRSKYSTTLQSSLMLNCCSATLTSPHPTTAAVVSKLFFCSASLCRNGSLHASVLLCCRGIQQQLSSYRETVIRQASSATGSAVHRDDAPTCGICHKTKFADGCGNLCSYCQTKFCARCGARVSLRSNTVRRPTRNFFFFSLDMNVFIKRSDLCQFPAVLYPDVQSSSA